MPEGRRGRSVPLSDVMILAPVSLAAARLQRPRGTFAPGVAGLVVAEFESIALVYDDPGEPVLQT
jgi:hypothetical protein